MTDAPPSPGVVEAARSALSTAEWHIAARMIELRDARQPSGEAAAALNKVRDAIRELSTVQPTAGGGGDREAMARIIDPEAWTFRPWNENWTLVMIERREKSLAKADAIIAKLDLE